MTRELTNTFARLRKISPELNATTDQAVKTVQALEKFLNEECSIGIGASVSVKNTPYCIGYGRCAGKFRIIIETYKDVSTQSEEEWEYVSTAPWLDSPRDEKLTTIGTMPELIEAIAEAAQEADTNAREALSDIEAMMFALKGSPADGKASPAADVIRVSVNVK